MVGIISDRTKSIDRTLRSLATDFRRTNIKSVKVGEAQPNFSAEDAKKRQAEATGEQRGSGVIWGDPKTMTGKVAGREIKVGKAASVRGEPVGVNTQGIGRGPRIGEGTVKARGDSDKFTG